LNETLSRSKTFHVVEWVRARAPLEVYQRPLGRRARPVKNGWFRL